jgi:hypothetical protein
MDRVPAEGQDGVSGKNIAPPRDGHYLYAPALRFSDHRFLDGQTAELEQLKASKKAILRLARDRQLGDG